MGEIDFRAKEFTYHCFYRNTDRTARFVGKCVLCNTRTYSFDDGDNDPRGVLGDHAADALIAEEYDMVGPDVPCCFLCQNDTSEKYEIALRLAKRKWHNKV